MIENTINRIQYTREAIGRECHEQSAEYITPITTAVQPLIFLAVQMYW